MRDITKLVSMSDIADRVGVTVEAVSNWRSRHQDFPEPVHTVARGKVNLFSWDHINAWIRINGK